MLHFEKYQQYAGGELAGANYDAFGIGQIVGALLGLTGQTAGILVGSNNVDKTNQMNAAIAAATNQANKEINYQTNKANLAIAEQTNKTNKQIADEANRLAREESEKAYQRSTQTNQIAELIRAGFSAQQAKQIVAGSGSPASYPAAPVQAAQMQAAQMQAAQMQPYSMQPYIPDTAQLSSSFAQLGSGIETLGSDLTNPNGGALGALEANDNVNVVFEHFNDIDEEALTSVDSFQNWYRSADAQSKHTWLDAEQVSKFDKMFKKANASRSFMYQLRDFQNSYSIKNQVKAQVLEYKSKLIDYHLQELNASWQDANFEDMQNLNKSLLQLHVNLSAEEFKAKSAEFQFIAEQAKLNLQALQQKGYKEEFLKSFLSDKKLQVALNDAAIVKAHYDKLVGEAKETFAKQFKSWIAAYDIFSECGLMNTNVGVGVATAAGATLFFVDKAKEVLEDDGTNMSPLQQAAEGTANGNVIWPNK